MAEQIAPKAIEKTLETQRRELERLIGEARRVQRKINEIKEYLYQHQPPSKN